VHTPRHPQVPGSRMGPVVRLALGAAILATIIAVSHPAVGRATSSATFPSASIVLSPTSGTSGTPVTIAGSGFPPGEIVALYIDVAGPYLGFPGPIADAQGGFKQTAAWPAKNYDPGGHVNPISGGSHTVCGDTDYPGSTQQYAVKACAQFTFISVPSPSPSVHATSSPNSSAESSSGSPIYAVLAVIAVLGALAIGTFIWSRRSP
jgi:hypothetical protein